MLDVKIQRIKDNAAIPKYAHPGDAGVDLFSTEEYLLKPGQRVLVSTGIKIAVPDGYEAQVRPRSGLALKYGISVCNTPGTVDSGYRGEVGCIVINLGNEDFKIEKGSKIAQMVFNKIEHAEFEEVTELDATKRGEGGFGSTGHK
ncbi:MAG TPA: dUTP diphosphatase [Candidatus Nanoarchaeia archaeon]|nr:dUTP diphosphatase [Candidatus Nanoarchaeia archaeon]